MKINIIKAEIEKEKEIDAEFEREMMMIKVMNDIKAKARGRTWVHKGRV